MQETLCCFIKFQSENIKITWNIRLFIFYGLYFFKCDGFIILVNNIYGINFIVFRFPLCNHNLILELHPKKNSTFMKGGFLRINLNLKVYRNDQ